MVKPYCIGSDVWNGLSKLIEEINELGEVCGKLIGSEGSTDHWTGDLREKFIEEIGDVQAACAYFTFKNFTFYEQQRILEQMDRKIDIFIQWDADVKENDVEIKNGFDHIANFLNSVDTEEMSVLELKKLIYKECIKNN